MYSGEIICGLCVWLLLFIAQHFQSPYLPHSRYQGFIPFYVPIVFHYMDITYFCLSIDAEGFLQIKLYGPPIGCGGGGCLIGTLAQ